MTQSLAKTRGLVLPALLALVLLSTGACSTPGQVFEITAVDALSPAEDMNGRLLNVVATTTLAGDALARVGGDAIQLQVLLKPGGDPHSFQARPSDLLAAGQADLIFVSGLGLEGSLLESLMAAAPGVPLVELSEGIEPLPALDEDEQGSGNPHVWLDPANVIRWTENAAYALGNMDPDREGIFLANARAYAQELSELDDWIVAQIAQIPPDRRLLVTDHRELDYFARRYGLQIAGALVSSFSSEAEPSARELGALEAQLLELPVTAIFVSTTVNPKLAERVAADTGLTVVQLYAGSLSDPAGPAPDYISLMKYNVRAVVAALR